MPEYDHTIHVKIKKKLLKKYYAKSKALDCDKLSAYVRLLLNLPAKEIKLICEKMDRGGL